MIKQKHIFVTIKATLRCNLSCQYCYGRENSHLGEQMSTSEVEKALAFAYDYALTVGATSLTICWHGGEPLLMMSQLADFIEEANRLFNSTGIRVFHGLQTNGVALLPKHFDFIKKYLNGGIGVSLDLYSKYRTFPNGSVSTDFVVHNIDMAIKEGICLGAINLITQDNRHHIADIYNFYKERNINVRLARVFPISDMDESNSPMYLSDEEFAQAMIDYFDIWANDPHPTTNRDILSLVGDLMYGKPSICYRESECHKRYIALSPGGDIFTCAEFDVPDSVVGNFLTQSAKEFVASNARQRLANKAPIPTECASCRFERICHGGCFRERYTLGYPYRCKSNYIYWSHIEKWLRSKGAALYILQGKSPNEIRQILKRVFPTSV